MIDQLHKFYLRVFSVTILTAIWISACNHVGTTTHTSQKIADMPSAGVLEERRGYHFERVITHFHTPYSFDACDGNPQPEKGKPNLACAAGIWEAICSNRINYIFASDHAHHMVAAKFEDLLFTQDPSEQVIATSGLAKGKPIARLYRCKNGHQGFFSPGVEGRLLGLGMTQHSSGAWEFRHGIYSDDSLRSSEWLRRETEAVIVIPHTESKSLELIERAKPDAIEIYNFHANFDPTIRKKYLNAPMIEHLFPFLDYIADPYADLNTDYLFMEFLKFFPVYFEKWNALIAKGLRITGLGGTDSHQNVIAQEMSDGERLDSYRRMTRFMTHFVLVKSPAIALDQFQNFLNTKASLREGRVFFTIEGLGTPAGFDFYSESTKGIQEIGDTVSLKSKPVIHFKIPHVLESSPGIKKFGQPSILAELILVERSGKEVVLARGKSGELTYAVAEKGAYRVKVSMVPSHLRGLMRRGDYTAREYTWMITNHIYVE